MHLITDTATREAALAVSRRCVPPAQSTRSEALANRALARDEAEEIREKTERTIELLRFLYGSFPLSQPGAAERAARIHQAVLELQVEIGKLKQALPRDNPAVSTPILARLEPLVILLTNGSQRYNTALSELKNQASR